VRLCPTPSATPFPWQGSLPVPYGVLNLCLAITYCYLLWRHKTNPRLRLIFLLGLFASVLWMLGFGFVAMLEFYGRKGLMADMVYLPLLAGSLILILTGILGWVHRAGGL
jgi:hypothetical protein